MSGFPELLPEQQIVFNRCFQIVREAFERFGYVPIETPSVERKEILTSKGSEEKEIYALARLQAQAGEGTETEFALHFDLTVPLARFVAQHKDKLTFPFRRYQMQKVWRGERAQKGRYREFYQCDIDVIGRGSVSLLNDAEIPCIIYQVFTKMAIGKFVIRVNNRRLLQGFFEFEGVPAALIGDVLRSVDRLDKTGRDKVLADLTDTLNLSSTLAESILSITSHSLPTDQLLSHLASLPACANPLYAQGLSELQTVVKAMRSLGMPADSFVVDPGVARGLGYYTGTVYETKLIDQPDLGSICSGGRYDDLASYFTNEKLPGVGISIGFSRLIFALLDRGVLAAGAQTTAHVLVSTMDVGRIADYLGLASQLRDNDVSTEVYFERKGLGDQLKFASRKGFKLVIIAGETEFAAGTVKIKDLRTAIEVGCNLPDLVSTVQNLLLN